MSLFWIRNVGNVSDFVVSVDRMIQGMGRFYDAKL